MAFYAGRVILHPAMANPTIVVLTDRNDLDDQLFGTFARCRDLLRQPPVQAADRADLRAKLAVASGGVVFTTIQKFFPEEKGDRHPVLSERRNIVVIADEAHRSQYDFIDGFARHMRDALPNASFIGFTGTPDREDRRQHARRVRRLHQRLRHPARRRRWRDGADLLREPAGQAGAEGIRAAEDRPGVRGGDRGRGGRAQGEAQEQVGAARGGGRLGEPASSSIARDLVEHFENRLAAMDGKAMVVVMSRRIAVELYREIVALRPEWHGEDDDAGRAQGRDDRLGLGPARLAAAHPQQAAARGAGAALPRSDGPVPDRDRARHVAHRLRRAEPAHDVRGQADARARADAGHRARQPRVQGQARRAGGGLPRPGRRAEAGAGDLHRERRHRRDGARSGRGRGGDAGEVRGLPRAVPRLRLVRWITGTPQERLSLLPAAQEHILAQEDGKSRLLRAVTELSQAFALAVPHEEALRIRDDVGFFQAVRAVLAKSAPGERKTDEELDHAIRQIISKAVVSDEVVDIFAAAGLKKPDISILSDEFLAEVRGMPQRNLAVELLQKLLKGEIERAVAAQRRPGALVRRAAGAGGAQATRTAPSRRRR